MRQNDTCPAVDGARLRRRDGPRHRIANAAPLQAAKGGGTVREKTRHRGAAHRRPGATLAALICIAMLLMVLAPSAAWAAPLTRDTIPEPLHPWTDWVLHGQEEARCPFFHDTSDRRACAWPSALALELADRGGRFVQQWAIYDESWVPLPGDLGRGVAEGGADLSESGFVGRSSGSVTTSCVACFRSHQTLSTSPPHTSRRPTCRRGVRSCGPT